MKLKMEIGALRGENEGLIKKNDDIKKEIISLEDQIQNANRSLRQKDGEVQETHTKITFLTEEVSRLKKQVESSQEKARRQSNVENETKIENAQLKSEHVAATDKVQQLQREILRIENEKKDNVSKIQSMHNEMRDLKRTL